MRADAQVISIITTSLAFIAFVGRPYIDAIYKQYPPDIKKHVSFIKKSLLFTFRYIVPIAAIILLMVYSKEVTKYFVLGLVLNVGAFLGNAIIDISRSVDKLQSQSLEMQLETIELMTKTVGDLSTPKTGLTNVVSKIITLQRQFLSSQKILFQLYTEMKAELKRHKIKIEPSAKLKKALQELQQDTNDEQPPHT